MNNETNLFCCFQSCAQGGDSLHVRFAGESQTLPEHALGPKIYDHYLLHIIESGHGIFRTETDRYQLGPGDCFLIHPGQIVSYVSDASHPWRYRWVAFDGEHAGEGYTVRDSPRKACPPSHGEQPDSGLRVSHSKPFSIQGGELPYRRHRLSAFNLGRDHEPE